MNQATSEATQKLGVRIRERREASGLSQESVAHFAEMHVSNYGKIERGQANPSLHTIVRIAAVLEIDPAELVRGLRGDMIPARSHKLTAAEFIRAQGQAG